MAKDLGEVSVALGQVHPVLGRVPALDLFQRDIESCAGPPVGEHDCVVGDAGQHHRHRREVHQRAQVGLALLQVARAVVDLRLQRVPLDAQRVLALVPGGGLQHQGDEVRERAGQQLLVQLPAAGLPRVLVTDDARHLAPQEHRGVEHRGDAQRLEVGRGEFAGAFVGQGVVGADRPFLLQRLEIARHIGRPDARAGRVPVLRPLIEIDAFDLRRRRRPGARCWRD